LVQGVTLISNIEGPLLFSYDGTTSTILRTELTAVPESIWMDNNIRNLQMISDDILFIETSDGVFHIYQISQEGGFDELI
jgi:hypothetical protein